MRLFAALDLDDAARERLTAAARVFAHTPGVKWAKPESFHVTLRFFGEWPADRLPELIAVLEGVQTPRGLLEIRLTRLAFLPNEGDPRVFVAVGETSQTLADFQGRVEEAARRLGFEPAGRAFVPHVTLSRIRDTEQGRKLAKAARDQAPDLGTFTADHWTLYRSETKPQGPVYTSLGEWRFDRDR